jgi:hypothetical protein
VAVSVMVAGAGWQFGRIEAMALEQQRAAVVQQVDGLDARLLGAAALGVDESDLSPIRRQVTALRLAHQQSASRLGLRQASARAAVLSSEVASLQRAE